MEVGELQGLSLHKHTQKKRNTVLGSTARTLENSPQF